MATTEPIEVTLAVTSVLERLEVEYVVGGSLATSLHGIPRATLDVDVVADLRMAHLDPFVAALKESFFVDADMVREAIRRRSTFNILHLATIFKVDVFVIGADELLSIELSRKRRYGFWRNRRPTFSSQVQRTWCCRSSCGTATAAASRIGNGATYAV
jgi:hypothetical protein